MKSEVKAYCDLIRHQVEDQTMKIIWFSFFDGSMKSVRSLVLQTPSDSVLPRLMMESPTMAQRREELEQKYSQFTQAYRVLSRTGSVPSPTPSDIVDLS